MNHIMLAEVRIGGEGMINQLVTVLIVALCVSVVWVIGWYFFSKPPFPAMAMRIWNGFFVLVGGLVIINFMLGLMGHGIKW